MVIVDGQGYEIGVKECFYIGKGVKEVVFKSNGNEQLVQFYFVFILVYYVYFM